MVRFFDSKSDVISSGNEFVVELNGHEIPLLALELVMIKMGLSRCLTVRFCAGVTLVLCANTKLLVGEKAVVSRNRDRIRVELAQNDIEYLSAFLLRTYRDGIADVNHIHIEGTLKEKSFDLTFLFGRYRSPMTPDEAWKSLNK